MPQPVRAEEDLFTALGLTRRFEVHLEDLEKRYYEISRLLHPDRFASAKEANRNSTERMSLVNQGYATLKSPLRLRDYLLTLEKIQNF